MFSDVIPAPQLPDVAEVVEEAFVEEGRNDTTGEIHKSPEFLRRYHAHFARKCQKASTNRCPGVAGSLSHLNLSIYRICRGY